MDTIIPKKTKLQGVPKKIGINDLVWYIMIWLLPIVLYGLDPNPGNSHKSSSDPGLVRVRPNTRTLLCLRCCQTRTSWCHFTLPFHLGWGGWYWRATTFSRELRGDLESKLLFQKIMLYIACRFRKYWRLFTHQQSTSTARDFYILNLVSNLFISRFIVATCVTVFSKQLHSSVNKNGRTDVKSNVYKCRSHLLVTRSIMCKASWVKCRSGVDWSVPQLFFWLRRDVTGYFLVG